MAKTSIAISDSALDQGKLLASARKMTLSQLVENLIIMNFNVKEITSAAAAASGVTDKMLLGKETREPFEVGQKLPVSAKQKGQWLDLDEK